MNAISSFIIRLFISLVLIIIAVCFMDEGIELAKQKDILLSIIAFVYSIIFVAISGVAFIELKKLF